MILNFFIMWACVNIKFAIISSVIMVLCGLYMAYRLSFNDSVIKSSAPVLISQQTTFDRCAIRGELTFSDRLNHFWLLFILSFLRMPFIFAVGCWAVSVVIYLII